MEGSGHVRGTDERQPAAPQRAVAQAAAPGPVAAALFLQRHAGNRVVARMAGGETRRTLARDELILSGTEAEPLDDTSASKDRYEEIAGPGGTDVLKKINPNALNFSNRPCTQNCPKAASDVQIYLNTGSLPASTCTPLSEPRNGYTIDPGPDSWSKANDWAAALAAIKKLIPRHGSCVIVEGDRTASKPADLTQWHYFVVANVKGSYVVVDGFIGRVDTDVPAYIAMLQAKTYSFTTTSITVKAVR